MFNFLITIAIIYFVYKKFSEKQNITSSKLDDLFEAQNFHNISKNTSIPGLSLITANSHGENYLFAQKNNMVQFSLLDIHTIYDQAQKSHIHNVVILPLPYSTFSNTMLEKLKEYDMQIWDQNKINSLIHLPGTSSVLSTSDTSDDKCHIDSSNFEPIQEPSSFWKNIFNKPTRL